MFLGTFFVASGVSAATFDVAINADRSFSPSSLTINTGDTVRWTENGSGDQVSSDKHTAHEDYPDPQCPNASCWDSPELSGGQQYSFTFLVSSAEQPGGTWNYHNHKRRSETGTITVTDLNAPAVVADLAASDATQNSVVLTWVSPGDDVGSTGNFLTPTSYDIRYSTTGEVDEVAWAAATQVTGEPTPQAAGETETMIVSGLSANNTYYFAIKASDEVPNEAAISNSPNLNTLALGQSGGGISDFEPPSDITDLSAKVLTTDSVELTWTAPGDDFDEGTAALYDVRYTTQTLTPSTFSFATQVKNEAAPKIAGTTETLTISGLIPLETYNFVIRAFDEFLNETKNSNIVTLTIIPPDTIAPSAVTDLAFIMTNITAIDLFWTSPGGDGATGMAASYDVRHFGELITEENWDGATQFLVEPIPQSAGAKENMLIAGFDHDTTFYIALKAIDDVGNESALSNVITFTTLPEPVSEEEPSSSTPPPTLVPSIYDESSLIRALGDDKVYLIRDGALLWIPTSEAFFAGGHDWNNIQTVNASEIVVTKSATLVRAEGAPEVYALHGDTRRHIPTLEAFENEGHAWDAIVTLSERELAWYPVLSLVKAVDDPKVFLIDGATKQWIFTAEVFISHGYDWNDIIEVESVVLDSYTSTGALTE